jgi:DNA-binding transcriptional MocR family regulator
MDSTWETREKRILQAVVQADLAGREIRDTATLAQELRLDAGAVARAVQGLEEGGYLTGANASTFDEGYDLMLIRPTAEARRVVGQWPSQDPYSALLEALELRLQEADPAERSRLDKLRTGVLGAGKEVVVQLLADLASRGAFAGLG